MPTPTTIRIPRARLYMAAMNGPLRDYGRVDNATFSLAGDPTITEDFDPLVCSRYEASRTYLRLDGTLTVDAVDGNSHVIAKTLLAAVKSMAAAVGKVYTSPTGLADNDLVALGWAPAGTYSNGRFTPDPLTTVEDSAGTPAPLALDTHYSWYEPAQGIVQLLDVASFTQPFVFTGDSRATERAVVGDDRDAVFRVVLSAVDHRNQCLAEALHLWRVAVQSGAEARLSEALDTDTATPITISFDVREDPTVAPVADLGLFGYWDRG